MFFTKFMKDKPGYINREFANVAIIKCKKIDDKILFEIIYSGDISNHNLEKTWTIDNFNNSNIHYRDEQGLMNTNTEIFLIRHGQGIHNTTDYDNSIDPVLTAFGIEQAIFGANELYSYMSIRNYFLLNLNIFLFSSVLYRTQQTVIQISKTIRER